MAGLAYMGEYPLSFAACLSQEASFQIILAAGADPDSMDTNGNSVTHMMVIHSKKEMLNMAYENGASTLLRNRQGLTPLSLAARFARKDLFFHILAINQSIYWKVGNITATATPLPDLDTVEAETGKLDTQAALNQIVFGKEKNHISLLDGVVVELLKVKWNVFIKKRFYTMFFMFLSHALLVTCYMLSQENTGEEMLRIIDWKNRAEENLNVFNLTGNTNTRAENFQPHNNPRNYVNIYVTVKVFLHFLIFLFSIGFHSEAVYESFSLGRKCFSQTLLLSPTRITFLIRPANNFSNYSRFV